jgi:hypothetical protein
VRRNSALASSCVGCSDITGLIASGLRFHHCPDRVERDAFPSALLRPAPCLSRAAGRAPNWIGAAAGSEISAVAWPARAAHTRAWSAGLFRKRALAVPTPPTFC